MIKNMKNNGIFKRLSAMALAFAMLFGIQIFGSSVNAADNTAALGKEIGLLRAVEILPEALPQAEKISRADFVVYTARLLNINDFEQNETRYFYDVPMNHYALNSINTFVEMNIISMGDDKTFRPDEIITFEEACKVLVSALGYEESARYGGGFPSGYVKMANRLNIASGVGGGELSTTGAIHMLYNALKAEVEEVVSISSSATYKKANGETVLSLYHDIEFDRGTVTAVNGMAMYGDLDSELGVAYVDDTRYECSADLDDIFGSYAEYYYKEDGSDRRELVYAEDLSNKTVVIDADDFQKYDQGTVYYNKDNKEVSVLTADGRKVVYNGRPAGTDIDTLFKNINYGTITIKQSENKGNDLIIIEDYVDMYVSGVSDKMQTITDGNLTNSAIEINAWENVMLKDGEGASVDYTSIPTDVILSVKKSADKKLLSGKVSTEIVSGEVERKFEENGNVKLVISQTEYALTKVCAAKLKDEIKLGASYKFYLNNVGKIAYFDKGTSNGLTSGYITNAVKNDNSFSGNLRLRMLTEGGKLVIMETADKVIIDGVEYTDADKMIAAFPSDSGDKTKVEPQLVMYRISSEKVREIDTYGGSAANEDKKNTLMRYLPNWNEVGLHGGRIGWKIPVRAGGKLYTVPEADKMSSAADSKFTAETTTGTTLGLIANNMNNEYYKLGSDAVFYDYIVQEGDAKYSLNEARMSIVTDIFDTIDEEDSVIKAISVLQAGTGSPSVAEYRIKEDISIDGLEKGDVIRFAYSGNTIVEYELLYDESTKGLPNWQGVNDYWNLYHGYTYYGDAFTLSFGYVNSKREGLLRWGFKSPDVVDEAWGQYISPETGGSRIMIWDTEQEKGYVGSLSDVIDYETYGKGSRIILQTCWGEFRAIVVYI